MNNLTRFPRQRLILPLTTVGLITWVALTSFMDDPFSRRIKQLAPQKAADMARAVEALVKPRLEEGLTLSLWGVDSLVYDPIAIDMDDNGRLYYTRTNRQKNSEFDIRGHPDWEIESNRLQTVEDKRAFLHRVLSPANSQKNTWLKDVNGDNSHDWRDMTVEKEQLFRLEDTNGDGVADRSTLVIEDFHDETTDIMGGVLADGNDLYVAVAPDLWRLRDKNGDGIADEKKSLSHGYGVHIGFSGHNLSGVEMGPDGRIYWQMGDIGFNGTGSDGRQWAHPNSGVVVRANPDGSDFEVFAYGVRNTHEFVFDQYGNLISEDNDGDHPGEKERLVYIVDGSDTGWRSNWQYGKYRDPLNNTYKVWMDEQMHKPHFAGQAAYFLPPLANYVSGPTGMLYNPGTALGPKYKDHFFVAEFVGSPAASGIHAFTLKPKGASFELNRTKKILGNVLATGLDFGPDGAIYVADWVNGWGTKNYGRIWKLDDKDGANSAERALTKKLLAEDFSKLPVATLGGHLKNEDMRVRQKAQFELAKRGDAGVAVFGQLLKQTDSQLARVHSIWGLSQLARKDARYAGQLTPYLTDPDPEIRAQVARWLGDMRYKAAGPALVSLLKDTNARTRFFAAEALGRLAYGPAVQSLIALLEANNDEDTYLRHAGSLALARIGNADALVALVNHPSKAVRTAAVVALRRMSNPGIARFLTDADEFIVTEAARGINDDGSILAALPALGRVLTSTTFTNEALIRRAINANLRMGTPEAMQQLIRYAGTEGKPVAMRAEAIETLSTWAKPSLLDRVDGRYRGSMARDLAVVKARTGPLYASLATNGDAKLRRSAIRSISRLSLNSAGPVLLERIRTDADAEIRVEALQALAAMNDRQLTPAVQTALAGSDPKLRVAAIELLGKTSLPKPQIVTKLSEVLNGTNNGEKKAALLTLGKLPVATTKSVFERLLSDLSAGKVPTEIGLEVDEAITESGAPDLIGRYKQTLASQSPDALLASYQASLYGGNAERGRTIFFGHETAQCIRCHAYDDLGGNAGPRLNGVSSRLGRNQLLEAVINPSARLAPGFGTATLEMKDGKTLSGIVQRDTATDLVVKIGNDPDRTIPKDQIVKTTYAPSSMPDMKYLLTKREIRDLVSFLATLKE
ncbi:PVC-type heme-binding CxxCH protein [Spirosoma areae]